MLRIGIDVGGTNTDAALLDESTVVATSKAASTDDTVCGIVNVLQRLRMKALQRLDEVQAVMLGTTQFVNAVIEQKGLSKVFVVRLCGTATAALPPFTGIPLHLTQSISAGYMLAPGGYEYDGTTEISPLQASSTAASTAELVLQAGAQAVAVCGVHAPINPSQELMFAAELAAHMQQRAPGRPLHVTLSHKLSGRLGLLEREAAAILNASLQPLAAAVVPQYSAALQRAGLQQVPLYLTGNAGTLLNSVAAQDYPVLTFKSGPVNSLRGAAYLAGVADALVCDIGGTTTDIGAVVHGMPRMCGAFVDICGICTNFQMPDVTSFGLGGGSLVAWQPQQQHHKQKEGRAEGADCSQQHHTRQGPAAQHLHPGEQQQQACSIGPKSVGSALTSSCLVCGGDIITASDVAVLLQDRLPDLVNREAAAAALQTSDKAAPSQQQLQTAWEVIQQMLAAGVDGAKLSAAPVPLVVVGGGAGLCGDSLPGVSHIIRPEHADVANAVGAAIPQVAGTVDTLLHLTEATRQQQLAAVVQQATAAAVAAGADTSSCEVVELEEVPVAYGSAGVTRVHVKVAGQLLMQQQEPAAAAAALPTPSTLAKPQPELESLQPATAVAVGGQQQQRAVQVEHPIIQPQPQQQLELPSAQLTTFGEYIHEEADSYHPTQQYSMQHLLQYSPHINSQGLWDVQGLDMDALAAGAQVLGAGGGGSARHNRLKLERALSARLQSQPGYGGSHCTTASRGGLSKSSNSSSSSGGGDGSSSDMKVPLIMSLADLPDDAFVCDVGGMGAPTVSAEKLDSFECAAAVRGLSAALPQRISALLCAEVGGGNALEPLAVGLEQGLPVVDADLMGRAFPELQMSTAAIAGVSLTPAAIADDKGNVLLMASAASPDWAERVLRAACTEMGCTVGLASSPMSGKTAKQVVVPGSLSLAWQLGMALLRAQAGKADPVAAILGEVYQGTGRLVFQGKVVDVVRHTAEGFVRGQVTVASTQQQQETGATHGTGPLLGEQQQQQAPANLGTSTPEAVVQHEQQRISGGVEGAGSPIGGSCLVIEFQNENLVARIGSHVVGCVPDLICVLETSSGAAVATEDLRYGLVVSVLVLPAHPLLRTGAALKVVGPAAFGYAATDGIQYEPVGPFPHISTVHGLFTK